MVVVGFFFLHLATKSVGDKRQNSEIFYGQVLFLTPTLLWPSLRPAMHQHWWLVVGKINTQGSWVAPYYSKNEVQLIALIPIELGLHAHGHIF